MAAEVGVLIVHGILTSWNPLSHSEYWTDDNFTEPVAEFLKSFI